MMAAEQLKNSILHLALQGKLVDALPGDKTAKQLLLEDQEKKEDRRKDVKQKPVNEIYRARNGEFVEFISTAEVSIQYRIPFEVPANWEWIHLGFVCDIARGGSPRPIKSYLTEDPSGINWIKIGDSDIGGKYIHQTQERIIPEGMKKSRFVHAGDFLLTNSMSFGRPYILNCDGCIHDGWLVLTGYQNVYDKDFLFYMLSSAFAFNQFCDVVSGAVVKNLNSDKVADAIFPVPPLEEQKRIVAKIEELMPFVEQYAKASTRLNTLNASFPEQMKKSILQQAVMGKLVPQDPNDEPVSVLLKKIAEEKQKLIKEGKIKKQKALPAITEDEIPFDIPKSWEWVRLDELAIFENGDRGKNYPNKSEYVQSGVAWINTGHIEPSGYLSNTKMNYITREKFDSLRSGKIEANDLVFCLRGATYGKVSRVEPYTEGAVASSLMIIRPIISVLRDYLLLYLKTPLAFCELAKYANGSAQPNLGAKDVRKYLVPLPPLKEQKRILKCVEEILPKLDDLRK